MNELLAQIAPLNTTRWQRARGEAQEVIRKQFPEPRPNDFIWRARVSRYPVWLTGIILSALAIFAAGMFVVSAGKQVVASDLILHPLTGVYSRLSAIWVDASIVLILLSGELGAILFSAGAALFSAGVSVRIGRLAVHPVQLAFRLAAGACAAFALLANISVSALHTNDMASVSAYGWFLTLMPPILVLVVGLFLERLLLGLLEARALARDEYEKAWLAWEDVQRNPERHPDFGRIWAAAIYEQLLRVSPANRQKIEQAAELYPGFKTALILAERDRHEGGDLPDLMALPANFTEPSAQSVGALAAVPPLMG
jgi:hypothetical protein